MSSQEETLKVKNSGNYRGVHLQRATKFAAGWDITSTENAVIDPNQTKVIGTSLCVSIPEGYVGMICSRSGLAAKEGIFVLNSPGIIDCDYRGELKVILANFGHEIYTVHTGERVAQLVLVPVCTIPVVYTDDLDETERGSEGLGSTGV